MFIRFPNALVAVRHIVTAHEVKAADGSLTHTLLTLVDGIEVPIPGVTVDEVNEAIDKAMSDYQYDVGYQRNDGAAEASRRRG